MGKEAGRGVAVEKLPQNVFENDFEPRLLIRRLPACLPASLFVDYVAIIWAPTATSRTPLYALALSAWQLQLQLVAVAATTSAQHKQTKQYGNVRCDAFPILLF